MSQIRKAYDIDNNDIATLNDAAYYYIYVEHNIRLLRNRRHAPISGG